MKECSLNCILYRTALCFKVIQGSTNYFRTFSPRINPTLRVETGRIRFLAFLRCSARYLKALRHQLAVLNHDRWKRTRPDSTANTTFMLSKDTLTSLHAGTAIWTVRYDSNRIRSS